MLRLRQLIVLASKLLCIQPCHLENLANELPTGKQCSYAYSYHFILSYVMSCYSHCLILPLGWK